MPNIALYGFSGDQGYHCRSRIITVLQTLALDDETVITIVPSSVITADGKSRPMPFIRVYSTDMEEIDQIIAGLKKAGMKTDTEWQLLGGFIDAKNMDDDDGRQT